MNAKSSHSIQTYRRALASGIAAKYLLIVTHALQMRILYICVAQHSMLFGTLVDCPMSQWTSCKMFDMLSNSARTGVWPNGISNNHVHIYLLLLSGGALSVNIATDENDTQRLIDMEWYRLPAQTCIAFISMMLSNSLSQRPTAKECLHVPVAYNLNSAAVLQQAPLLKPRHAFVPPSWSSGWPLRSLP